MRKVRPTIRALRELPAEMFEDKTVPDRLRRGDSSLLEELDGLSHPILEAARAAFRSDRPCQLHQSSTKSAGQNVFEVEEKSSGWRGAVVVDDHGDPWLVFVDSHDAFHRRAASALRQEQRSTWYPGQADYLVRNREELAAAGLHWRAQVAGLLLDLIADALSTDALTARPLPELPGSTSHVDATLGVALSHDPIGPEIDATTAHQSHSLATITVRLTGAFDAVFRDQMIGVLVAVLGSDPDLLVPGYLPGDRGLVYILTMTKADLIQLLDLHRSKVDQSDWPSTGPVERTHKHYIRDQFMTAALIEGRAVRAACGIWFVPTRDAESARALPLCPRCEAARPLAQAVLEAIRQHQTTS